MNQDTLSTSQPGSPVDTPDNRERRERVNASTGPRTEAGKAISSRNALKHGLRSSKPENAVPVEMRRAYSTLRNKFIDEYQPLGPTESALLDLVILAAWQLQRIHELEIFAPIDLDSPDDPSSFGTNARLARYRASYERMFHTNLKQLSQIQQERLLHTVELTSLLPRLIPPGVRLKPLLSRLSEISWRPKARAAKDALVEREEIFVEDCLYEDDSPSDRP